MKNGKIPQSKSLKLVKYRNLINQFMIGVLNRNYKKAHEVPTVKFLYIHCKETLHFYKTKKLYLVDSYCFVFLAWIMKYDCQQFNS